jgi:hypothetical protein
VIRYGGKGKIKGIIVITAMDSWLEIPRTKFQKPNSKEVSLTLIELVQ